MNFELSSVYSNYNLGAKVVKNHELCKSLLYLLQHFLIIYCKNLRHGRGLVIEIACD